MAKKYPRISLVKTPPPQEPTSVMHQTEAPKRVLDQTKQDLTKLKISELVNLLTDIVGHQPNLPKKPRKPDLLSKILDVATPRGD